MPTELKPWYASAPHEDIRKGQLAEAVFAEIYIDSRKIGPRAATW